MSVVLSLVHLLSVPFLSFRWEAVNRIVCTKNKKEDEISLSLSLFVGGVKKKLREKIEHRGEKDK